MRGLQGGAGFELISSCGVGAEGGSELPGQGVAPKAALGHRGWYCRTPLDFPSSTLHFTACFPSPAVCATPSATSTVGLHLRPCHLPPPPCCRPRKHTSCLCAPGRAVQGVPCYTIALSFPTTTRTSSATPKTTKQQNLGCRHRVHAKAVRAAVAPRAGRCLPPAAFGRRPAGHRVPRAGEGRAQGWRRVTLCTASGTESWYTQVGALGLGLPGKPYANDGNTVHCTTLRCGRLSFCMLQSIP